MEVGEKQLEVIDILHLSHAFDVKDGGISACINQLISAQKNIDLSSKWVAGNSFSPLQRGSNLINQVIELDPKILHLHGLWRSHTRIAAKLSKKGFKYVLAPHGMVDSWSLSQSRLRKKLVWRIWESHAFKKAECIHALCPAEADAIRNLMPQKKIAIIPNGVEIPSENYEKKNIQLPKDWKEKIPEGASIILFLGRFHKKKGIYELINAWEKISGLPLSKNWWLCLVGYGSDAKALINKVNANNIPRCLVFGPAFGKEKADILRSANSFILPSFSEGLPIAALEAMSFGLPCLLSSSCNLPEAYERGAAISAEPDTPSLIESLKRLFLLNESQLISMSSAGKELVSYNYNWSKISNQTQQLYEWINTKTNPPNFLQI